MFAGDYKTEYFNNKVSDVADMASVFCGLSGLITLDQVPTRKSEVILGYTWMNEPGNVVLTEAGCIQGLQRRQVDHLPPTRSLKIAVTIAGSIWKSSTSSSNTDLMDTCYLAFKRAFYGDTSALAEVRGDYVCAILTSTSVMLIRSPGANRNLYYRVDDVRRCVVWSTNYMDLVEDPIEDIDTSRLAPFVWGNDVMFYPQIESVAQGEFVKLYWNGSQSERLISETAKIRLNTDDFREPKKEASLTTWAKKTREVLLKTTLDRAAPFDKVGVLLSGGIDSAAIASCLRDGGIETVCYHVSSQSFPFADEYEYAAAVCRQLDLPLRTIDVSEQRLPGGGYLNTKRNFIVPHNQPHLAFWDAAVDVIDGEVPVVFSGLGGHLFSEPDPFSFWSTIRRSKFGHLPNTIANGLSVVTNRQSTSGRSELTYREMRLQARRGVLSPYSGRDIYTEYAIQHITRFLSESFTRITEDLHVTSINLNVFSPNGMIHLTPYTDNEIDQLLQLAPKHEVAFQGRTYPKPILNLAFVGLLPPKVIRRDGNPALVAFTGSYCANNTDTIGQILHSDSALVRLGIIDHNRLLKVLNDRQKLSINAHHIINACLVTLWFQSLSRGRSITLW